ncbi:uncharacterized protein LOC142239872 [Haematobia irritans]|uniref:uncharacterized protein LOC142239872 n=1 Tax=Haematobia irritans TaxID=7368 RepID=UPI003F4F8A9A
MPQNYLPQVRPEHKSTKVRIVFNAFRKSKSGVSLNDVLYTGPTHQNDLISTILNWRKYKYVYSGDIQNMYRQIKIHPDDRAYQRILLQKRESKSLVSVLNSAGFPLKKITANDPELLKGLLPEDMYDLNLLRFAESSSTKILAQTHTSTTKRQMNVKEIPRWIQYMPTDKIQIHGFCDESKEAYCACVYLRLQTSTSTVFSNLFMAKSKVAPLKPVLLPKLELNGALLLSHLVKYVSQIFDNQVTSVTLWSDASIVLGWVSKPPYW